ncbi:hypothetical protein ACHAW5_009769 [Stephanodiscus triporus]|uniref:Methyltransferase domain-containing protein n=1 Tax=Stephanodiscus triporus TaxID=2934178 RepID=A0ABD3QTD5_9STRA
MSTSIRANILAESWSRISNEYERILVPRFAPWTRDALDALRDAVKNEDATTTPARRGKSPNALVLCCGPGQELLPIARILGPASRVLGTDLAPGMVDAARRRIEAELEGDGRDDAFRYKDRVAVEVGDAMTPPPGPYDVVFSAFGLQQLPRPVAAVESWLDRTEPGGICAFIYWPPHPPKIPGEEETNPFELWGDLVRGKLGKQDGEGAWDENIEAAIRVAEGEIIDDRFITHDIRWKDGRDMFEGMSRAGPWHAMRLRRGDEFVDLLGEELIAKYPPETTLVHAFTARMIVARRVESNRSSSSLL